MLLEPSTLVRLDLACGQSCKEGFQGVDIAPCKGVDHVVNLWTFPWPWETSSVDEINCSHHVEHIPMVYVASDGKTHRPVPADYHDRDLFMAFFDEAWRILKPGGKMFVQVPTARSNRGYQDPTHRRFLVAESFLYLSKAWRDANRLDHYGVSCDFDVHVEPVTSPEEELWHETVQAKRHNHYWNIVHDWRATLTASKGAVPELRDPISELHAVVLKVEDKRNQS